MTFKTALSNLIIIPAILINGCGNQKNMRPQTPLMGWSSWNNFQLNISEEIICQQADAMVTSGMKDAGYRFINIDHGYFDGRDENCILLPDSGKFPNGMKVVADYIHSKDLKAGIYTRSEYGLGDGLCQHQEQQHEEQDMNMMLKDWGYDFIKINSGDRWIGLDPKKRYTELSKMIREIRPDVVFNICRGKFLGVWVTEIADSWRISGDIEPNYESILHIIDLNANWWPFAGPGHVNDMDMLQVGRGMTYEEDKAHFSMWCMMASPLITGNDLRDMSDETLEILTNKEVIALNQDPLVYQARRLRIDNNQDKNENYELWAKPLDKIDSGQVAVALLNRSDKEATIGFTLDEIGLDSSAIFKLRDLWKHKDLIGLSPDKLDFSVPAHGVAVLKVEGKTARLNPFVFPLRY